MPLPAPVSRSCRRLFMAGLLAFAVPATAAAQLTIRIDDPNFEPLPIAIVAPQASNDDERSTAGRIAGVVTANLEGSGLFRAIDPSAFVQRDGSEVLAPRFNDWKGIGAEALITGRVFHRTNGDIRIEFRLWDVATGRQLVGRRLETGRANWRRLAHKMSDAIYRRLTGESGYFDTRVVYVAESGPVLKRVKRLAIMDQDGANHRFLTNGKNLVMTPRFSPSAQEITYLEFVGEQPRVYILDIDSGQREIVGEFEGMTFAPRFSPDGNRIVMSLARDGNSEIYAMDLRTRATERLTRHPAIDTSPSYAPDGSRIVFDSDRSGRQKIYVMNADGSGVRRISNRPGRYATPVWSPRGDLIAFTKLEAGAFFIGVMQPNGEGERILAQGYLAEGPTWAPNGRVLMYYKKPRGGTAQLYSIDLTGRNERPMSTPEDASDPAWSPLLED
ncbi:MAG: Tol-Pal system beta propeller repeat protein TolB [Rhodospirillaceae bacterium]|nr:Tol-Pal system beta propeller repeat protein TolB [Rhodospirillaceae bacterium]